MSYFNDDQVDHMRYLATLKPEEKCDCGWSRRGECCGRCYGNEKKGGAVARALVESAGAAREEER